MKVITKYTILKLSDFTYINVMVIEDTETIADSSRKTLKQEIAECSANKFSHQLERDVGESTDAGD